MLKVIFYKVTNFCKGNSNLASSIRLSLKITSLVSLYLAKMDGNFFTFYFCSDYQRAFKVTYMGMENFIGLARFVNNSFSSSRF